jgi:hypothetical protein
LNQLVTHSTILFNIDLVVPHSAFADLSKGATLNIFPSCLTSTVFTKVKDNSPKVHFITTSFHFIVTFTFSEISIGILPILDIFFFIII